jgi:hypothetical protein
MASYPPTLVSIAREVHLQLLDTRGDSRTLGQARATQEAAAAAAPRYETESFDVSCGKPPTVLISRLPPMLEVIISARALVDLHVLPLHNPA